MCVRAACQVLLMAPQEGGLHRHKQATEQGELLHSVDRDRWKAGLPLISVASAP